MASRVMTVPMVVEGVTLMVEVAAPTGTEDTSRLDTARDAVTDAFDRAQTAIVAVATSTVSTMGKLGRRAVAPEEVEIKFGLKFAAEGSVIVAGVSGEATLEVTLKYMRSSTVSGSADAE